MSSDTSKPTDASTTRPERPGPGQRMPSLNQLAARINAAPSSGVAPVARPRLAAALLRTNSSASLATNVSASDSVAVNAPSSRAESPSFGGTPVAGTPRAATPSEGITPSDSGAEPLTEEKVHELEKANAATGPVSTEKKIRGYKNIPSLDAITARLAKARTLSVDGSAQPPEPETIEHPKTPGIRIKAPEHPLEHSWVMYHDSKAPYTPNPATVLQTPAIPETPSSAAPHAAETHEYEAGLTVIGEFDTVESFCRYFNWLKPPSKLEKNANYHLFKTGIKPMWEDPANANGGKWVLTMKNNPQLLDRCWAWAAMALVGEELDEGDEICGVVVSLRAKVDRLQVWTRSKEDVEKLNGIAKRMSKILDVSEADGINLEFQYNSDDRPPQNKFLQINAVPQTSYRSSFRSPAVGPGEGPGPVGGSGPGGGGGGGGGGRFGGGARFGAGGGGGVFGGGSGKH